MAENRMSSTEPATVNGNDYEAPAIEEVVSREGMEREVAYAGTQGPSVNIN
jgi:hypothetical protein